MYMQLYLFGSPRLERGGKLIKLDTRKALAILAYLAVSQKTQSRDTLAAFLWSEYDQTKARAALRRTLSTLKKGLDDGVLLVSRDAVSLSPDSKLHVDVLEFLSLADSEDPMQIEKAVRLYRDSFLAGFSLRDCPGFDDWQFFQGEQFRQRLSKLLEQLVEHYSRQKNYERATFHAKQWLELDTLNENAHRWLMKLFAFTGQRALALRQYRECVRILDEELRVTPLEETSLLYTQIQENQLDDVKVANPKQAQGKALPSKPSRLVGRGRELAALKTSYEAVGTNGMLAILEGEAGIGKTVLAETFLNSMPSHVKRLKVQCYEGEAHLAYEPFIEGFRTSLLKRALPQTPDTTFWLTEVSRLVPELRRVYPDLPHPQASDRLSAQGQFFEACTQIVALLLKSDAPGILFIENVHYADDATLELLAYIVKRLEQKPLFVLVTLRSEQVNGRPGLKVLLRSSDMSTVISLPRLTKEEALELIAMSATDVGSNLSQTLYEETQGIPLFLVECLADLDENTSATISIPEGLRHLFVSRLDELSDLAKQLLSTAAVIGHSFSFDSLRISAGRSEEETVRGIEGLLARDFIAELADADGAPSYHFRHTLLRTLMYDDMSLARKRLLHRRTAEALTQFQGLKEAQAAKIAQHYKRAGQDELAAQFYVKAGHKAKELYANSEALAHFRTALALGYPDSFEAHSAIGDLLTLQGDYKSAVAAFEMAASQSEGLALATLEHKLADLHSRLGSWDVAESHFIASSKLLQLEATPALKTDLFVDWGRMYYQQGNLAKADELAQLALQHAQKSGDTKDIARVHNILGVLAHAAGDSKRALFELEKSLNCTQSPSHQFVKVAALNNSAVVHVATGELKKATDLLLAALPICQAQGDRHREAALHNNLADLYHKLDQPEPSMKHLKRAVTLFTSVGASETPQPEIWKLAMW